MSTFTDTERLSWLLARGAYDYVQHCDYPAGVDVQEAARRRIDEAMHKERVQAEAEVRGDWLSLTDTTPPLDVWVETKGGYADERIVRDYISALFGDWMKQPGDPTHWRHIPKSELNQEEKQ